MTNDLQYKKTYFDYDLLVLLEETFLLTLSTEMRLQVKPASDPVIVRIFPAIVELQLREISESLLLPLHLDYLSTHNIPLVTFVNYSVKVQ